MVNPFTGYSGFEGMSRINLYKKPYPVHPTRHPVYPCESE
jgi:hypothetical protein